MEREQESVMTKLYNQEEKLNGRNTNLKTVLKGINKKSILKCSAIS